MKKNTIESVTTTAEGPAVTLTNIPKVAHGGLHFEDANTFQREVANAQNFLTDPAAKEALWNQIMTGLLVEGAILENREVRRLRTLADAAALEEQRRVANIQSRQDFWKSADVSTIESTIEFFMGEELNWVLCALRESSGEWIPTTEGRETKAGRSMAGTSGGGRQALLQHFEAHNFGDRLGLDIFSSKVVVLRGQVEDLNVISGKWNLSPTVTWLDESGYINRIYSKFNGARGGERRAEISRHDRRGGGFVGQLSHTRHTHTANFNVF